MNNTIGHNNFYNTFTPFLTPKTKTAEKTINGKDFIIREKPYNMLKNFYTYIFAGGFLLVPIIAFTLSRKNILDVIKRSNIDYFKATYSNDKTFSTELIKTIDLKNNGFLKKIVALLEPISKKRENITSKLNNNDNQNFFAKIFRKTNNILKRGKESAAIRKSKAIDKYFNELEKVLEEKLNLISDSAKGELKILFPKELLKTPQDELPKAIDVSKTAAGQDRAEAIRSIISKIKTLLKDNPKDFEKIVPQITNSCEDIFFKAENNLIELNKTLENNGILSDKTQKFIGEIYENLIKYRYAQILEEHPNATSKTLRNIHLDKIKSSISELKSAIAQNEKTKSLFENFENIINNDARADNMGLLEQLRKLLKCDDIKSDYILDHKQPALFKYYRPEEYIALKRSIQNLAKELKFAQKTQNEILPNITKSIDTGKGFLDGLSIAAPAGYLLYKTNKEESNHNSKRNLLSFLTGAFTIAGSRYLTLNSRLVTVLYGLGASLLTSRIYEIVSEHKKFSK